MEGSLADAERAVLESHLLGCSRCQGDVEEWRALFSVLAELPQFTPSAGFADRVMAGVQLPLPWYSRAVARVEQHLPRTTRGWALVTAFVSLPVLVFGAALAWLLSRPGITTGSLVAFVRDQSVRLFEAVGGRIARTLLTSEATLWIAARLHEIGASISTEEIGAAAAVFAVLSVLSGWVLYHFLFQTSKRETHYVSYSF